MSEDLDYNYNGDVIVRKAASPSRARPSGLTERQYAAVIAAMQNAEHDAGDFDDQDEDAANARDLYEGLQKLTSASAEWQPTPCPTCKGFCGDTGPTCAERVTTPEARAGDCDAQPNEESIMDAEQQIQELANFIMAEVPGEPSQSEGAVETAIRWMRERLTTKATP